MDNEKKLKQRIYMRNYYRVLKGVAGVYNELNPISKSDLGKACKRIQDQKLREGKIIKSCRECGKKIENLRTVRQVYCDVCKPIVKKRVRKACLDRFFTRNDSLIYDRKNHKRNEKVFKCVVCYKPILSYQKRDCCCCKCNEIYRMVGKIGEISNEILYKLVLDKNLLNEILKRRTYWNAIYRIQENKLCRKCGKLIKNGMGIGQLYCIKCGILMKEENQLKFYQRHDKKEYRKWRYAKETTFI
jgi:hypothetical protein